MYLQKRRRDDKRNEVGVDEDPVEQTAAEEETDEEFDEDYVEFDSELDEVEEKE
jgi:hypothetical protein